MPASAIKRREALLRPDTFVLGIILQRAFTSTQQDPRWQAGDKPGQNRPLTGLAWVFISISSYKKTVRPPQSILRNGSAIRQSCHWIAHYSPTSLPLLLLQWACSYSPDVRKNTPRVARWVVSQGQAESPFSRHTLRSTGAFLVPITGQYNCQGSLLTDSL